MVIVQWYISENINYVVAILIVSSWWLYSHYILIARCPVMPRTPESVWALRSDIRAIARTSASRVLAGRFPKGLVTVTVTTGCWLWRRSLAGIFFNLLWVGVSIIPIIIPLYNLLGQILVGESFSIKQKCPAKSYPFDPAKRTALGSAGRFATVTKMCHLGKVRRYIFGQPLVAMDI